MILDINRSYRRFLITCSGGADSSILLYMLVKHLEKIKRLDAEIHVLTMAFDRKGRWNAKYANSVIDFIIEDTGTKLIKNHLVFYRDTPEAEYLKKMENFYSNVFDIDMFINGRTANPPLGQIVEDGKGNEILLTETSPAPERNTNGNADIFVDNPNHVVYRPFVNLDKKVIRDLYKENGLLESLFPLTRSCEGFDYETDNYTTTCGRCWWCLERKWAFGDF